MQVRFWGVRGSIATPGPATVRYGGNTSCVEVRSGDSLGILDCGTGAHDLGSALAAEGAGLQAHLFISHVHWDHIQGFPFFLPAFLPTAEVQIFGAAGMEQGLEEALAGQMQYTYFPVRLGELRARLSFHEVEEDTFQAGAFTVSTQHLNHTCPAVGYRLTGGGATVAYLSDHEPWWPHDPAQHLGDLLIHPADRRHVDFATGADLLIHDAQYTAEEYPARRGWGHSTVEYVVDVAIAAGVSRLALFHHDPTRSDEALDALVERARERARERGALVDIFAAAEGGVIEIPEKEQAPTLARPLAVGGTAPPGRILILGDQERRRALREAVAADGYRINEGPLDRAAAADWASLQPDLVLVALGADADALVATRAVSRAVLDVPVLVVLEGVEDQLVLRHIGEFAADVIEEPFGAPNLRARLRAALARNTSGATKRGEGRSDGPGMQILEEITQTELDPLLRQGTTCGFRPGEVLFRQGDRAGGIYYVRSGAARVLVATTEGREITIGTAGPGDSIGEMAAIDGAPRSATVVATEPMEATYVSREAFLNVLHHNPDAALRLLTVLTRRLRLADLQMAMSGEPGDRTSDNGGPEAPSGKDATGSAEKLGEG